jgi:hypothetical protein
VPVLIWLYGLLAAVAAVSTEAFYRSHVGESWGYALWPGLVGALVTNLGIWGLLQTESVMGMAVVFSLITAGLRITYALALGEPVSTGTWAAFALVVAASVVKGIVK